MKKHLCMEFCSLLQAFTDGAVRVKDPGGNATAPQTMLCCPSDLGRAVLTS